MKTRHFTSALAILLTITLVAPSAFLIAPQRAHAIPVSVVADIVGWPNAIITAVESTFSAIKDELNLISTYTNTAANVAQQINTYVLQPLAFIMSGNLMKLLTAKVLDFIIGKANGTGAPQFVQDVNGMMQKVGDTQANAFFVQFGKNSNSPFASAITSSLRTNYLWNTSSAGFFAQNRNTLSQYSPNVNSFLAGNWSQGGVGAWFALTTQTQNNPYTLYQASQSQLASVVQGAQSARKAALDWGQGFLSWCGASDTSVDTSSVSCPSGQTLSSDTNQCYGSSDGIVTGATPTASSAKGIAPGDACYNKDGTPGKVQTPGSTIKETLDKVLGGTQDKLVQMGQMAKEVNGILGSIGGILSNVGTVAGTVMFASDILGGSNSGGLFGVGQNSATNPTSRLLQYQSPGYLGVTPSTVYQNAATLSVSGPDMLNRVARYESSWNTLRSAANSASTTVASLASFCTFAANTQTDNSSFLSASAAQAVAARSAIITQIAPILVRADAAAVAISNARAMVQKIQSNLNSGIDTSSGVYLADLQTLQTMPPTDADFGDVLIEIESFNTATAIPAGSLTVAGGSIIDRMSLIATNAVALKSSVCTAPASE